MSNSVNVKSVSEKAIKDTLQFIHVEEYDGLSTEKEVIEQMLESVNFGNFGQSLQTKVHALVYGGCFRIYNDDILQFLETLDLNENTMKRVKDEPMEVYANVLWHAIKRYIKYN